MPENCNIFGTANINDCKSKCDLLDCPNSAIIGTTCRCGCGINFNYDGLAAPECSSIAITTAVPTTSTPTSSAEAADASQFAPTSLTSGGGSGNVGSGELGSKSSLPVAAIAGGAAGAVVLIVAVVIIALKVSRHRRSTAAEVDKFGFDVRQQKPAPTAAQGAWVGNPSYDENGNAGATEL